METKDTTETLNYQASKSRYQVDLARFELLEQEVEILNLATLDAIMEVTLVGLLIGNHPNATIFDRRLIGKGN